MQDEAKLIAAIASGDGDGLERLLDDITDVEKLLNERIESQQPTNHCVGHGMTLLQFAALRPKRHGDSASILLERGATLDIHSACGLGKIERVEEMLADNPDLIRQQVDTYFPIQFAITGAQAETIEVLCRLGDDPRRDLTKVAYFGWEDEVLERNSDARETSDSLSWKPIHMASLWCFDETRTSVLRAILDAGGNACDPSPLDGFQPLHLVTMPNRVHAIRCLVARGVDVNVRTSPCPGFPLGDGDGGPLVGFQCAPLMVAAAEGFVEATECLLELGADPTLVNDQSMTALDFAERRFWDGQPYDRIIALLQ